MDEENKVDLDSGDCGRNLAEEQKAKMKAWKETFIINSLACARIDHCYEYKSLTLLGNKYVMLHLLSPHADFWKRSSLKYELLILFIVLFK